MSYSSPLWPARLHHFRYDSPDHVALAAFYERVLGMSALPIEQDLLLVRGPERALLIGKAAAAGQPFIAMGLTGAHQVSALENFLRRSNVRILPSPTLLFAEGAFAVADPDGRLMVFGVERSDLPQPTESGLPAARLPARLQHVVIATADLKTLTEFYAGKLGFDIADTVSKGEATDEGQADAVAFFRADTEHHSFAAFLAPNARPDHHCYETLCWNDIRDWLDHLARGGITPWWGPGRHGVGGNVFFMIKDPDGNNVEFSAELEVRPKDVSGRRWPNVQSTINMWGKAWNRMES